jgi:hypothetical protein
MEGKGGQREDKTGGEEIFGRFIHFLRSPERFLYFLRGSTLGERDVSSN